MSYLFRINESIDYRCLITSNMVASYLMVTLLRFLWMYELFVMMLLIYSSMFIVLSSEATQIQRMGMLFH